MNDRQQDTAQERAPKRQSPLLLLLGLVVLLALAYYGYGKLAGDHAPPMEPDQGEQDNRIEMADVTFTDMDGQEVKLLDLTGKPMVFHFWATWCGVCKVEMPDWETIYQEFGDEVTFVMVDMVGQGETVEIGKTYLEENGFTFPVYFDTKGEVAYVYEVTGLPTTLFVDSEGYYVTGRRGMLSLEEMRLGISLAAQATGLELEGLETDEQQEES